MKAAIALSNSKNRPLAFAVGHNFSRLVPRNRCSDAKEKIGCWQVFPATNAKREPTQCNAMVLQLLQTFGFSTQKTPHSSLKPWKLRISKMTCSNLFLTTVSHERLLAHPVLPNAPGHGYHCPCCAGHTKHQGRLPHCLQDPVGPIDEVELLGVHQVLWVAKLTEDPQKCPTSHQANERIRPRSCKGKQRHQNCDCSETHLGLLGFCGNFSDSGGLSVRVFPSSRISQGLWRSLGPLVVTSKIYLLEDMNQ